MKNSPSRRPWAVGVLSTIAILAVVTLAMGEEAPPATSGGGQTPGLTEANVVAFAGGPPERCVHASGGLKLCSWALDGRLTRSDLPLQVPRGVNLVCVLPVDSGSREGGACRAHLADASGLKHQADQLPPVGTAPIDAATPPGAEAVSLRLARSRTVSELSHLVGDAPDRCHTGASIQTCTWSITDRAEGYPVVSALVPGDGEIELRCELPLDGSERALGSCSASLAD